MRFHRSKVNAATEELARSFTVIEATDQGDSYGFTVQIHDEATVKKYADKEGLVVDAFLSQLAREAVWQYSAALGKAAFKETERLATKANPPAGTPAG